MYVFSVVRERVIVPVDGQRITIKAGEVRFADDPVVRAFPEFFTDEPQVITRFPGWSPADVEQATAAPGERRTSRRAS
jgi:hypothetical protein